MKGATKRGVRTRPTLFVERLNQSCPSLSYAYDTRANKFAHGTRTQSSIRHFGGHATLGRVARAVSVAALIIACVGCAPRLRSFQPPHDPRALTDTAFLHYLPTVSLVTVDEGFRAVLMLTEPSDPPRSFEGRFERMRRLGAVRPKRRLVENQLLDKGTLAYALARLCKMPKSLNQQLAQVTGWGCERYALRVCVRERVLQYAPAHALVTGGELLAAIAKADTYIQGDKP